ncbi:MAG: hypothetical protein HXY25_03635 [Alphaproteobacteria bacterium]|nr:hypothetical protein [Alphaproteobacteria bacterium]
MSAGFLASAALIILVLPLLLMGQSDPFPASPSAGPDRAGERAAFWRAPRYGLTGERTVHIRPESFSLADPPPRSTGPGAGPGEDGRQTLHVRPAPPLSP